MQCTQCTLDVCAVVEIVREGLLSTNSPVSELRKEATEEIAARRGVNPKTVHAHCTTKLGLRSVARFDAMLSDAIRYGGSELKNLLLRHDPDARPLIKATFAARTPH